MHSKTPLFYYHMQNKGKLNWSLSTSSVETQSYTALMNVHSTKE